ncbi:MAG: AraC family transcriptional regulator [Planctomycetota bacterium]
MDEIPLYDTMADFYAAIGGSLRQDFECTIHRMEDIHGEVPYRSHLFRANYYSVVLITAGATTYIVDDRTHRTRPGTVFFTNPGHVKGYEVLEPACGFVLTFSEAFLKETVRADVLDDFPFLISELVPPKHLTPERSSELVEVAEQMLRESEGSSPYRAKVIGSLLMVLLLKLREHAWDGLSEDAAQGGAATEADGGAASHLVRTFQRNLEAHFRDRAADAAGEQVQVQELARQQGLHPTYLSTVVRRRTGRTVQEWIAEKTTAEAKALLARSSLSVKEVAFRLGFADPGHFSRYFKRQAGLSPTAFRGGATSRPPA